MNKQGVQVRHRNPPFPHSAETDAIIRQGYKTVRVGPAHGQRCSIADIVARLKQHTGQPVTDSVVECRARHLGLTKPQRPRVWSPEEDRIVVKSAHLTSRAIRARLTDANPGKARTIGEINVRRRQLVGETREHREDLGVFTPQYLVPVLGVQAQTIIGWIKAGWLKAELAPCDSKVEDNARPVRYLIREKDLRRFIPFVANRLGTGCSVGEAA